MRLRFLPDDKLDELKANVERNMELYTSWPQGWVQEYFGEDPFVESRIHYDPFEFYMDEDDPVKTDLENVKRFYSALKHMSESDAADEGLWSGLAHDQFSAYLRYRWPINKPGDIKNHYFFGYSQRRSLERHGLARLWWIGWLTYDDRRSDCFELTPYLLRDTDFVSGLMGRNFSSNKVVTLGILGEIQAFEQETGQSVRRDATRDLLQYLNLIGGTYLLDAFDEQEIRGMVRERLEITCGKEEVAGAED